MPGIILGMKPQTDKAPVEDKTQKGYSRVDELKRKKIPGRVTFHIGDDGTTKKIETVLID